MQCFLREQRDLAAEDSLCHSGRKGRSAHNVSAHTKTLHFSSSLQQTGLPSQVHLHADISHTFLEADQVRLDIELAPGTGSMGE